MMGRNKHVLYCIQIVEASDDKMLLCLKNLNNAGRLTSFILAFLQNYVSLLICGDNCLFAALRLLSDQTCHFAHT